MGLSPASPMAMPMVAINSPSNVVWKAQAAVASGGYVDRGAARAPMTKDGLRLINAIQGAGAETTLELQVPVAARLEELDIAVPTLSHFFVSPGDRVTVSSWVSALSLIWSLINGAPNSA